jgi:heparan-alpha-glucosaminide N-acetyltransferase
MTFAVAEPAPRALATPEPAVQRPARLASLDAYRGAVMLLMAAEIMHIPDTARHFPNSGVARFFEHQFDHLPWAGCTLWDMIQPSFMFMVGVALPFSLASRRAKGQSFAAMFLHALWRSVLLLALSIFLVSVGRRQTYWVWTNVLSQIALGYPLLFLLAWVRPRWHAVAAGVILFAYWQAFALYPTPRAGFDWKAVGVPANWGHHYVGFAAHWEKSANVAWRFDKSFLNLFPRERPWNFSEGGYQTLNFIPSLATMIFGLLAGELLRGPRAAGRKVLTLLIAGAIGLIIGWALDVSHVCPMVKRIWTPSWAIFSGGWACIALAALYAVIDIGRLRGWAFPLVIVGMNSIAMYVMAQGFFVGYVRDAFRTHLGERPFLVLGVEFQRLLEGSAALVVLWLICLWMYRRKVFIRL